MRSFMGDGGFPALSRCLPTPPLGIEEEEGPPGQLGGKERLFYSAPERIEPARGYPSLFLRFGPPPLPGRRPSRKNLPKTFRGPSSPREFDIALTLTAPSESSKADSGITFALAKY